MFVYLFLLDDEIDGVINIFCNKILSLFVKHIPVYRFNSHSYPPLVNADIIRNVKLKDVLLLFISPKLLVRQPFHKISLHATLFLLMYT